LFKPLLLVQLEQGVDQRIEVALQDRVKIEVLLASALTAQAMVGAAVLGEVVGADALRAVAAAHHALAGAGNGRVLLRLLALIKRRTQQRPRPLLVLRLAL